MDKNKNETDYKEKYADALEMVLSDIKENIASYNSFSDSLRQKCGITVNPVPYPNYFETYKKTPDEYLICLSTAHSAAVSLSFLLSDLTGKDYEVRLNKKGYLELYITCYDTGVPVEMTVFTGRFYNDDIVFNAGCNMETHFSRTLEELNRELAEMGITEEVASERDAAALLFRTHGYVDIGYDDTYGAFMTYIISRNGLRLSLNKDVGYSDESDAENELYDFIEQNTKKN